MAKNDSSQAQQSINQQGQAGQGMINQISPRLFGGNDIFQSNYNMGSGMNLNSYDDIMRNYRAMMQSPTNPNFGYQGGMAQPQGVQYTGDPQAYFQQLTAGKTPSLETLVSLEPQLRQAGINLEWNARRTGADIRLPDGRIIDVVTGMENPDASQRQWAWQEGGGPGGFGGYGDNAGLYAMYQALAQGGGGFGWDPMMRGAMGDAISGYGKFAETGGFSPEDLANIRARGVAPIRAVYANAQQNLNRNRALQPFSPNYAAATAKMAREQGYGQADALQNVNAGIAQMVQQGKLAGLGGLSSTGAAGQGLSTNIDQLNLQGKLAGLGGMERMGQFDEGLGEQARQFDAQMRMNALRGMTDLYGTNPALANVFGSQVLQSGQNLLGLGQLQNQLGLGMSGRQIEKSQIPGQSQQIYNSIAPWLGLGSNILGAYLGSRGGGGNRGTPGFSGGYNPGGPNAGIENLGIWG